MIGSAVGTSVPVRPGLCPTRTKGAVKMLLRTLSRELGAAGHYGKTTYSRGKDRKA